MGSLSGMGDSHGHWEAVAYRQSTPSRAILIKSPRPQPEISDLGLMQPRGMGERHGVESDTRPCSEPKLCLHALVCNNEPGRGEPADAWLAGK
jgi:hypothetical protein